MDNNKEKQLGSALAKNFELQPGENTALNEIKALLTQRIRHLLDTNMEKLLSILYIIDVNQKITDEIFGIESKDDIAVKLADAVIVRQLEKLKSREHYRESGS